MATNKFATMLHKSCHKTVVILIYAVLEWILILLLLLNSLFSYLIGKFAKYFGLKPSCIWCTRLDHVFDHKRQANAHRNHICEAHGTEITKLSYCSNHKRLAESKNLCGDCSSSRLVDNGSLNEISSMVAFFTWVNEGVTGNGVGNRCSCCDEILMSGKLCPPSMIFKPSLDVLDYYMRKNACIGEVVDAEEDSKTRNQGKSLSEADHTDHEMENEEKKSDANLEKLGSFEVQEMRSDDPLWNLGCEEDDESLCITDMLLQDAECIDSDGFICIELIDTDAIARQRPLTNRYKDIEDDQEEAGEAVLHSTDSRGANGTTERSSELMDEYKKRDEDVEKCKQLDAQEKALNELYAELEEERKAAAVAANQTMAMITKLQEEKAAMQMEALQYQRMMEEQAEYDQEALQLLNDLMLKRDKEKQQLEKELEMYHNKVLDYEARERTTMVTSRKGRSIRSTVQSTSNDNCHSVHLNSEDECDDAIFHTDQEHNLGDDFEDSEEARIDQCILPDISLAEFDEERLSILEELKVLEAKLFALDDDDRVAKKLLPLFDANDNELMDEEFDKEEIINHSSLMVNYLSNGSELEKSKHVIQEELSHVYERLQALEADKEFLKHCINSMMKGNKGLILLQEILQHLRDLRSVELSFRNLAEIPLPDVSRDK